MHGVYNTVLRLPLSETQFASACHFRPKAGATVTSNERDVGVGTGGGGGGGGVSRNVVGGGGGGDVLDGKGGGGVEVDCDGGGGGVGVVQVREYTMPQRKPAAKIMTTKVMTNSQNIAVRKKAALGVNTVRAQMASRVGFVSTSSVVW